MGLSLCSISAGSVRKVDTQVLSGGVTQFAWLSDRSDGSALG